MNQRMHFRINYNQHDELEIAGYTYSSCAKYYTASICTKGHLTQLNIIF